MIAVDTNLLVYAHRREMPDHPIALGVMDSLANGDKSWAIPWPCCYEFLSVVTNRRIWKGKESTMKQAWKQLEDWLASPPNGLIGETEDFLKVLSGFVRHPKVRGAIIHDARIAAICVANGVEELLTRDRDFSLFPELKTRNPF
ncbi:MAG: PIN domain-containing protein [Candidatus Dadabacteria bacterium]|nr:PIN domain-containing protein [Candidatus Dadabacteria bacterium]